MTTTDDAPKPLTKRQCEALKCRITPAEFKAMRKRIDAVAKDIKRLYREKDRLDALSDELDYEYEELVTDAQMPVDGMIQHASDEIAEILMTW